MTDSTTRRNGNHPTFEWVMPRQGGTTVKVSGIVNDVTKPTGNSAYPLECFQRVISVAVEKAKIVHAYPKLNIMEA